LVFKGKTERDSSQTKVTRTNIGAAFGFLLWVVLGSYRLEFKHNSGTISASLR
jgi:hypothetical protein